LVPALSQGVEPAPLGSRRATEETDMADQLPFPDTGDAPGTPRWVKVFAIIAVVVLLVIVIMMFTGVGGDHGPSRHIAPSNVTDIQAPSADRGGHSSPEGGP
jgi:hypothetical protein